MFHFARVSVNIKVLFLHIIQVWADSGCAPFAAAGTALAGYSIKKIVGRASRRRRVKLYKETNMSFSAYKDEPLELEKLTDIKLSEEIKTELTDYTDFKSPSATAKT